MRHKDTSFGGTQELLCKFQACVFPLNWHDPNKDTAKPKTGEAPSVSVSHTPWAIQSTDCMVREALLKVLLHESDQDAEMDWERHSKETTKKVHSFIITIFVRFIFIL